MDTWFAMLIQYVGFGLLGAFALLVVFLIVSEYRSKTAAGRRHSGRK